MSVRRYSLFASRFCSLSIAACLATAGCSSRLLTAVAVPNATAITGNWQMASTDASAAKLPMLSGELSGSGGAIRGIVHASSASDCVAPAAAIALTGAADAENLVTLDGGDVAGGTLSITGTLAPDGKSLRNATYMVVGGSCAFPSRAQATANAFSPVTGTYTGGFSDANGQVVSLTANLTQTPSSDPNGNFQLSGSANFLGNACFSSPVAITNSLVTGGNFNVTYADSATLNSVTASGTFSTDGLTLTATNWTLTGPCGPDSGTGSLTRH